MGGGQRSEYSREPRPEFGRVTRSLQEYRDTSLAEPWPDCHDQNFSFSNDKYWSPEMWMNDVVEGSEDQSTRKEVFRQHSEPVISLQPTKLRSKKTAHPSYSAPFPAIPGGPVTVPQSSPFDFDDFLATVKTEDNQGEISQPDNNKSRFKQFFDSGAHPGSPPTCKSKQRLYRPPVSTDVFVIKPLNSVIDQDTDEITEEDMIAATSRFQKIRDASIASLVHDSSDTNKIQNDDRPPEVLPQPLTAPERDRPARHKVPSLSPAPIHTPNRWSPNVPTPPPHAPPNVATTALLQARLLAQQRSSGIFPSGQVAQLVRPSAVPVYQAGVQAGLPLQSAALLSQFVWLNVL